MDDDYALHDWRRCSLEGLLHKKAFGLNTSKMMLLLLDNGLLEGCLSIRTA